MDLDLGYDEGDFFSSVRPLPQKNDRGIPITWVVKPHPKESPAELRDLLAQNGMSLPLVEGVTAIEAVAASDVVLGMCSSVLFEAALLGKAVVSLQPGMSEDQLQYLRIFDHLGIPKIVRADEAPAVVSSLVNGRITAPDLTKVPFPLGNRHSAVRITAMLKQGIAARRRTTNMNKNT